MTVTILQIHIHMYLLLLMWPHIVHICKLLYVRTSYIVLVSDWSLFKFVILVSILIVLTYVIVATQVYLTLYVCRGLWWNVDNYYQLHNNRYTPKTKLTEEIIGYTLSSVYMHSCMNCVTLYSRSGNFHVKNNSHDKFSAKFSRSTVFQSSACNQCLPTGLSGFTMYPDC